MFDPARFDGLGLPDVFLTYQQKLMASVSQFAVVVWEKSRRTGFSWAAAAIATLTAASTRAAGGMDALYIGYNLEMAREFIDYVGEWAKLLNEAASEVDEEIFTDPDHPEKEIKAFRVTFASGFKVLALPSVPRSLRGLQGLVIIDEAAFHDDLNGVMKAAFALLIWGGKVLIISTHDGDANPFNVLVQDIRAGRLPYHLGRTTFDDALTDGLYKRICLTTGAEWSPEAEATWRAEIIAFYGSSADEELFAIPSAGSGAYLSAALIEARMQDGIPVIRLDLPPSFLMMAEHLRQAEIRDFCERELRPILETLDPNDPTTFGHDFGRKRDLSVFWPLVIRKNLVKFTPFALEMRNVPYEAQRQILFYITDRLPRFRAGKLDATGNGGFLAEAMLQRYGERIEAVMLNEPWYRDNMPRWKAEFEDGTIIIPRDREIGDDHRLVKLVRGVGRIPEERTGEVGKKRHGDSAVASALAVAASRAEVMIYEYEPAPRDLPRGPGGGDGWYGTAAEANEAQDRNDGGFMPGLTRRDY
jgi:phage FluMu gp28-like protein